MRVDNSILCNFLVTFRPNWWIIGAIFEEICIYVEELRGFGQPLIPFHLLIRELQAGPYMVRYWVCQNTAVPFAPTVCMSIVMHLRKLAGRFVDILSTSYYRSLTHGFVFALFLS